MLNSHKSKARLREWRIYVFALLVILGVAGIFYRLLNLAYFDHTHFVKAGQSQYNNPAALISGRGDIYISDLSDNSNHLIATNKSFGYVYANSKISSSEEVASQLSPILNISIERLIEKMNTKSNYRVLADHLPNELVPQINKLNIKGITAAQEIDRFYLNGSTLAPVTGFVGYDGRSKSGRYGIEAYYDDLLSGEQKTQNISGNKTYTKLILIGITET